MMKWVIPGRFQVAVISLLLSVIWLGPALATVPVLTSLGQMRYTQGVPTRLALDDLGNLYLADARAALIVKYNIYGKQVAVFPLPQLSGAITVSPDGSKIYAATNRTSVAILNGATGSITGYLGGGQNQFGYAYDLDLDKDGYIFVADAQSLTIRSYAPNGEFLFAFGGKGNVNGQFNSISSMAVNRLTGEIFVTDSYLTSTIIPRVQVFGINGGFLRSMNSSAGFAGTTTQYSFAGIAFDTAGRGYFLNDGNSTLLAVLLPSTHRLTYSKPGVAAGQLLTPWDVAYDPTTKRLFVLCADSRIEIFGVDGGQNPVYVNNKPSIPTPVAPVAGGEVATIAPTLVFRGATDADGDPLSYEVEIQRNGQTALSMAALTGTQETISAAVSAVLEENSAYSWRVRAYDGNDYSNWSGLQPFVVNAVEEAPTTPALSSPLAGETRSGTGSLNWQATSDPDPNDTVSYLLEISSTPDFASKAAIELLDATAVSLSNLTAYSALEDGKSYLWRVVAVDNHGKASPPSLSGQFVYDTTLLTVTANMPGAKVYFGGNHGYAGRLVGEAPLELRDIQAGATSIVVERSGFEPFIAQVHPVDGDNLHLYAELAPQLVPADPKSQVVKAGSQNLSLPANAAPFAVDFDHDGTIDLLVGDASGAVTLFKGIAGDTPSFGVGKTLNLPLIPGASPFVADWNNDGRKDLLLGGSDGTVTLFLNTGSESTPAFGAGQPLAAATVGGGAGPLVIDYDGDGAKDLLVGDNTGKVFWFRNAGSDSAPLLVAAGQIAAVESSVTPALVDWDGDGRRDLVFAAGNEVLVRRQQADGTFAEASSAFVEDVESRRKTRQTRKDTQGPGIGHQPRVFALDLDQQKGKDLVVGNAAGALLWVGSNSRRVEASFLNALPDKVAQVKQLTQATASGLNSSVAEIDTLVKTGQIKAATRAAASLRSQIAVGTELARIVAELEKLLQAAN